jgi:hypothetical protein
MANIHLIEDLTNKAKKDLQIVVIDSFYDTVNQNDALFWLGKLFRFKVNSYRKSYPYGILPFSESDLIGTHWMLCERTKEGLEPLAAFKSIDSKRTEQFHIEFPAFGIVNQSNLISHYKAIATEMEKCHSKGHGLGYLGSWTVRPEIKNRRLSILCRKVCVAMFCQWVKYFNIQTAITFASLRFHVEKTHQYLGMTRLKANDGSELADFLARPFFDEPACVSVLYSQNQSAESKQDALDYLDLWENRIVISSPQSPVAIKTSIIQAA